MDGAAWMEWIRESTQKNLILIDMTFNSLKWMTKTECANDHFCMHIRMYLMYMFVSMFMKERK